MNTFVALVGRPNVGKSTLFNNLIGKKKSITHDQAGTTLDIILGTAHAANMDIQLADGPGVFESFDDTLNTRAQMKALELFKRATLLVFVIDASMPMTIEDRNILNWIRKQSLPFITCATKADFAAAEANIAAAEAFIGQTILPVAALQKRGLSTLLHAIQTYTENSEEPLLTDETIKVALLGRPNVGKSSLFNLVIGEDRALTSDLPGTTRDPIDCIKHYPEEDLTIQWIDTAGLRRRNKISEDLEYFTYVKSQRIIEKCDVAVVMLSSDAELVHQDESIIQQVLEQNKALILVVSKIDLFTEVKIKELQKKLRGHLQYVKWAPMITISSKAERGIDRLFVAIKKVSQEMLKKIPTQALNHFFTEFQSTQVPPLIRGHRAKIYYGTHIEVKPPTFMLFVNEADIFRFSYLRAIENSLRERFGFIGCPIIMKMKSKAESSPNPFLHKVKRMSQY